MKDEYRCPYCKEVVEFKEKRMYETLIEHVMDPNRQRHPRMCYTCTCEDGKKGFWTVEGHMYTDFEEERTKIKSFRPDLYSSCYRYCLINSYGRKYLKKEYILEITGLAKVKSLFYRLLYRVYKSDKDKRRMR